MKRVVGAILVILGLVAQSASARPATVPLPPVPPPVFVAQCPFDAHAGGCYVSPDMDPSLPDGAIYITPPNDDRFSLNHEEGHAFDWQVMTHAARKHFEAIMHLRGPWWPSHGTAPAELFADEYSECRLRRNPEHGAWTTSYGPTPTARQHFRVCALIRRVALNHAD
jgi:hypothetical protein